MIFSIGHMKSMPDVRFSRRASNYYRRLRPDQRERIAVAIKRVAAGDRADVKALVGQPGYFRLRVGTFRVVFRVDGNSLTIRGIKPRGDAY